MNNTTGIVNEIKMLSPEQESTKQLILAKMQSLEQIKVARKKLKEKLEGFLMESNEYKVTLQKTNIEKEKLKLAKEKLAQRPEIFDLKEEIKALNEKYNETKKDISDYLIVFQTSTGQLSFVDPTGNKVEIVRSATPKIVKVDFKEKFSRKGRR